MQVNEIDEKLLVIAKKVESNSLNLINPINSKEEKENFFSTYKKYSQYNPSYKYLDKINLTKEKNELEGLKKELKNSLIEKIILKRLNCLLEEITLLEMVNTKKFCNSSKKVYGEPNNKEVNLSLKLLQEKFNSSQKNITPEQMLNELKPNLIGTGFSAEIKTNMSASASINLTQKKLYLNKEARFNQKDVQRLKVHEIETHIYRYLNGLTQPVKILSLGNGEDYLKTEEGLAMFNEEQTKSSDFIQERIIAGRLYAVRYALTHDFFDTFDEMKKYFDENEAYTLTQRVKRGIPTGEKGAFTKDYGYYSGLLSVREYYNCGKRIEDLYYGKISLDEIKIVKKIKGIQQAKYLPEYLSK